MHISHLDRVAVNYGGRVIFRDLSWPIGDHDRIGLVGPNGAGKSSILKLLAGALTPDEGSVTRQRGIRVGYLPQEVSLSADTTLYQTAASLPPELAKVEAELARIESRLGDP